MRFLITGATGNVGQALIKALFKQSMPFEATTATRRPAKAQQQFTAYPTLTHRTLDYTQPSTYAPALVDVDAVFWLRPPQISDVKGMLEPFVLAMKTARIQRVLLLSVQGAERSTLIPHRQMELLLEKHEMAYIFVRPSYFMQNLTTTLYPDLQTKREICLPAGQAPFNWIDVQDIGQAIAQLLLHFDQHQHGIYTLTGTENLNFAQATATLNQVVKRPIRYRSLNPFSFYWYKRRQGLPHAYIVVLIVLHFLPRFQAPPTITTDYFDLTGQAPTTLLHFAQRMASVLDAPPKG